MVMKVEKGAKTKSGNHSLVRNISSLDEFWEVINSNKSIFARHRMYPTAFFFSWNIKLIKEWIDKGWFWTVI